MSQEVGRKSREPYLNTDIQENRGEWDGSNAKKKKTKTPVLYIPGVYSGFDVVQYKGTFKQTKKMPTRTPPPSSFLSQEVNNLENL